MEETLLQLKNVSVQYGGVKALDDVSVRVDEGEIVALMGPNGAGKSTVLKALFGLAPMARGKVFWHEQELRPVPHEMAVRGIAYVPQGRQVFKNLSVYENLELGGYALANRGDIKINIESVLHLFPALKEKPGVKAGLLSGGQQQMLAIARALVADPKVLLLDEPSLGLAPKVVKEVFEKIREINKLRNIAIIIVEHSVQSVLTIAHRAYVLAQGKVFAEKNADDMREGNTLSRAFFGA